MKKLLAIASILAVVFLVSCQKQPLLPDQDIDASIGENPDTGEIQDIPVDTADVVSEDDSQDAASDVVPEKDSTGDIDIPDDIVGDDPDMGSLSDISADTADII